MEKPTLSRKELYHLVWSTPISTLSKQFSITVSKLRTICKRMNIPIPDQGYWQRKKFNKQVEIPDLPEDNSATIDSGNMVNVAENKKPDRMQEIKEDIEKSCKKLLRVPKKLVNPDNLIVEVKNDLDNKYVSSIGREAGYVSTHRSGIPVYVTPKNLSRSLIILDSFVKLVRARHHSIKLNGLSYEIIIDVETYEFGIREKQERVESTHENYAYDYNPTGILVLTVGRYFKKREFFDGKQPLEKKLSSAVAYLEYLTEYWKKIKAEHDVLNEELEAKKKVLFEIRERKEYELKRIKELFTKATLFHHTTILRNYINAVELNAQSGFYSDNLDLWIEWAKNKVEWFDPLINRADEILSDEDKETLLEELNK